jgi:hypothetical protein
MGNFKSNQFYINNSKSELERNFRKFESNLITHNDSNILLERSFSSIYSQICFISDLFQGNNKENLEKFLKKNFTEKLSNFIINNLYFHIQNKEEFDLNKIKILLFLLSFNTNETINKKQNPDKVK